MRKSMKFSAIAVSAAGLIAFAGSGLAQDHSDHSGHGTEEATEDVAEDAGETPEVTVDAYIADCDEFLGGLMADMPFSPEQPTVMRYSMSLHPGADAKALWQANAGGVPAGLVEHGQGFQEGDIEGQRDRLDEGGARYLVWPDHPPMYVYAAERVSDADAANAINAGICQLGKKGLYLDSVNFFTILGEYTATEEE